MVGRLVDQGEGVLLQKQRCQLQLGLFPTGELPEGTPQRILIHLQQRELPFQSPLFAVGRELLRHLDGKPVGVLLHRHREIAEIGLCLNAAGKAGQAIRLALRAQQQAQQGGLSPAVASGQAQSPVGVQRGGKLLKNRLITALIAKGQVG